MGPTPDTRSLEELKSIVIPALFAEPSRIGEYGPKSGGATLEAVADLLEQGSVSLLARKSVKSSTACLMPIRGC